MSLYCAIDSDGDYSWWYNPAADLAPLATKRMRRCSSCGTRLAVEDPARAFHCWKSPETELEERIHGDEVPLRTRYMCETCSDLYDSIAELKFCCDIDANLRRQIAEYRADNGPMGEDHAK